MQRVALTTEQIRALQQFFRAHPSGEAMETREHGFAPMTDPWLYMWQELYEEPNHQAVRDGYESVGMVTDELLEQWMQEELLQWDEEHAEGSGKATRQTHYTVNTRQPKVAVTMARSALAALVLDDW